MIQCHEEKFVEKLSGRKGVDDVLQRLGRLTQDEGRITAAQILVVVYGLFQTMRVVMEGEQIPWARHLVLSILRFRCQAVSRLCLGCPWYVLWATMKQLCG